MHVLLFTSYINPSTLTQKLTNLSKHKKPTFQLHSQVYIFVHPQMEAAFNPSIAIPFPYSNYGITNVPTFTPSFSPHQTTSLTTLNIPPFFTTTTPTTTTTTTNTNTSTWMDARIWSCLPQPLLDRILAFLPLPAFFRVRSVCKRWYALLYSNSFLQLYIQVSPTHNWFIFFTHKTPNTSIIYRNNNNNNNDNEGECCASSTSTRAYVFDPNELKWYTIPFPLIPLGFSPTTSSGGLICWASDQPGLKNIFLHNPLVGSVAQLPPTRKPRLFPSVGLSITKSSIDLILAGDDMISPYAVKNLTSEMFHIDSDGFYTLWDPTSALPRLCSLESGRMVSSPGPRFYCMNYSPYSVLAYDVVSNLWWKIQAPMRRFLRSPCLVEINNTINNNGLIMKKVVLVAAVEKSKLNVPRSLRMWVLQECGTQWVEIERMPQQLYAQFEQVEGGRGFDCVGSGEFIAIIIKGVNNNDDNNKGLLFDMNNKRWVWMPCCPRNHGISDYDEGDLHGFAYQPTLVAPVTSLVQQLGALNHQSFTG